MIFYSHPNKKLIDHLQGVYNISEPMVDEKYKKANEIICLTHDFGKFTDYFQEYLFSGKKSELSNHGFISALFAAYISLGVFGEDSVLPLISYNCVLHHHGSIENISANLPRRSGGRDSQDVHLIRKIGVCLTQLDNIKKNRAYIEKDLSSINYQDYFNEFLDSVDINQLLRRLKKIEFRYYRNKQDVKYYFIHQMLYSALIAADKIDASGIALPQVKFAEFNDLKKSRDNKFKSSAGGLNQIREDIFDGVQESITKYYDSGKLFTITAPTGTGKTYTGFFAALKLNELLGGNKKIIYCLPFTSIIDQNFEAIYELFNCVDGFSRESSKYIMKHHNLSNVDYVDEYVDYNKVQSELLMENWSSGIIITTFVQLFETFVGSRNRMLKKFHNFRDAIILLDEVQAIDIKYYALVDYVFKNAAKYLNCRIIMMTATKPILLSEAVELVPNCDEYFRIFNRTIIYPQLNPETIEEFANRFIDNIENKSYLIICNTIKQSIDVYNKVKNVDREVFYLSTNLLPIHRIGKIEQIKNRLKEGKKIILVSTQVVEAGVDMDFDVVIRDIAPFDSIIQAAGRCNRNNGNDKPGAVYVCSMVDENQRLFGISVYGATLINITKKLLEDKVQISESDYYEMINAYFKVVSGNKNQDTSKAFIDSIEKLYFSSGDGDNEMFGLNRFSLITNNPGYMDVYFRIDDDAEEVYSRLLDAIYENDYIKKKEKYLDIKNKVKQYTLSVPIKYHTKFDTEGAIANMPQSGCLDNYDSNTGFKRDYDDYYMIF